MAKKNYAFIKDGNVVNIAVFDDPSEELLRHFIEAHNVDDIIPTTDKAVIGGEYDGVKFWSIRYFQSWIKNEELNEWEPPIPYPVFDPEDPRHYEWNEDILNWEEVQLSE